MKRIFFSFLFVLLIGSVSIPSFNQASAAVCDPEGTICTPLAGGLCCSKSCPIGFPPKCAPRGSINCHCVHPGASGRGEHADTSIRGSGSNSGGNAGNNSGFVCDKDGYKEVTLCQTAKDACFNDPTVKDVVLDWSKFPESKINGVRCAPPGPAETVECHCLTPGIKGKNNNGFVCTQPNGYTNNPLPEKNDYCGNQNYACWDDPTYTAKPGERDRTFFPWNYQHGVVCRPDRPPNSSNPVGTGTSAPPAAIPCATLLPNGKCIAVSTSLGLFSTEPGPFIVRVFGILLAASGSIAVIIFMRAGYRIMSARGNPEGIKDGREQLVAAILGLMFLIFSFVFLQVIAADLLKIPGF